MSSAVYERIRKNPRFDQLVQARSKLSWSLSATVLVLFYGMILVIAFNPTVMGMRFSEGSMITLGPVVILLMFVLFWGLTALYVKRANSEFDDLTRQIVQDAEKGSRK